MTNYTFHDTVALPNSKLTIPRMGFGVYLAAPEVTAFAVKTALKLGYRHIDTAQCYFNEAEVGEGVRASGIPRSEIYITTKIMGPEGGDEETYERCKQSVEEIGLGYVDLFLIHTPDISREGREECWRALERLMKEGLTKSIGVSNYGAKHIREMKKYAKIYPPAVNQIEVSFLNSGEQQTKKQAHPWFQQRHITDFCAKEGIPIEAYSPIVRNQRAKDPLLQKLAKKYNKSTPQVLIRYSLQNDWIPLVKSENEGRIKENTEVFDFELTAEEVKELNEKEMGDEGAIEWLPMYCD
jgi:diketogulonate reductase-like aldo/keto reductase